MIQSILDTDLYKFSMQQAVLEVYPDAIAKYTFRNRSSVNLTDNVFIDTVLENIEDMQFLSLSPKESDFLHAACPFLKPGYIEYLRNYRFNIDEVSVTIEDGALDITIDGPWHRTILWEVPLLAIISEAYFKTVETDWHPAHPDHQLALARAKGDALTHASVRYADFGTRRRRNGATQENAIKEFMNTACFVGTSNVHFAHKHGLRPIGTNAHEWTQAISVLEGMRHANRFAMDRWHQVYKGNLGTALTDTFGSKAFLNDFDMSHAKLWDGVRHDSGDPYDFADAMVSHYRHLRIDPMSKFIIFSDSLNVDKAIALKKHCEGRIGCSVGIGTHFTNDFEGSPALNIVIKLIQMDGIPTVKLSDDVGKAIGDPKAVDVARWVFGE